MPHKGLGVALQIASLLPQVKFLFVKGRWSVFTDEQLENFLYPAKQLKNVTIIDFQSDTKKIYSRTNILLVPSSFEETFGRVILEAQCNGIPVIAANVGGVRYTVGKGGILVDREAEISTYTEAILKLSTDRGYYRKMSEDALENSERKEFNIDYQINEFKNVFNRLTMRSYSDNCFVG